MIAEDILSVIYAPQKAFKKIIQNPGYLGAIIILVFFVVAQLASSVVIAQRLYPEQTVPKTGDTLGDTWVNNATWWQASSGVSIKTSESDYIPVEAGGQFYLNNTSILFSANNVSSISIQIPDFNQIINCGPNGYGNLSLRIKELLPITPPSNVTLYLYSADSSSFYRDVTNYFTSNTNMSTINVWNNLTIPLNNAEWQSMGSQATWQNITGIKLQFNWQTNSNVDLLLGTLFFRGVFQNNLEASGTQFYFVAVLNAITPFLIMWLILTGMIWLVLKGLKINTIWRPLMSAVGLALIPLIFQALISIIVYYTSLPNVYYPTEVLIKIPGEFTTGLNAITNQLSSITQIGLVLQVAIYIWIGALSTFIIKEIATGLSWTKSIIVAAASLLLTIIISALLGAIGL